MKKYLFLILALSILFIGCEKEGVYNPNKKIKRIYEESLSGSSPKRLSQEWTWEKKQLKRLTIIGIIKSFIPKTLVMIIKIA